MIDNASNTAGQLGKRLDCNSASTRDLNEFVFKIINPQPDEEGLEIGCGLGKQLVPMAGKLAKVIGLELSQDILKETQKSVVHRSNVELIAGSMDELDSLVAGRRFDLAYSCYALYYSKNIAALVRQIATDHLKPHGRFFVVAPDVGNNETWFNDLQSLFSIPSEIVKSSWVSRNEILPALLVNFEKVVCQKFSNEVAFTSVDQLMKYYDGCGAYCDQGRRAKAEAYFRKKIETGGPYVMEKRALGIVGYLENA